MAITTTTEILGQVFSSSKSYKYLFEPLRVKIIEAGSDQAIITIELLSLTNGSVISTFPDYVFMELNASGEGVIDIMEVIRDFVVGEIYKIGVAANITGNTLIPGFYVKFSIVTDVTLTPITREIIPLIGGRNFNQFTPVVDHTSPLTEWAVYGLTQPEFVGYPKIVNSLNPAANTNINPTVAVTTYLTGREVCGGYLIWKSRLGGWMTYGFDMYSEEETGAYGNEFDVGFFNGVSWGNNPYVPTNYTERETSYSVQLKQLAVTKLEAMALKSINSAPVVYFMRTASSKLELMRVDSASIPIDNLKDGADVSVSLRSISRSSHKVR